MRVALLAAAAVVVLPMASFAQKPAGVDLSEMQKSSESAAKSSLATLAELAKGESGRSLGFSAPGEADQAVLKQPLTDFIVGLDALRAWQPSDDAKALLKPSGLIVYPVASGDAVRSSVTLEKEDNAWKAVAFGAPALTQAVTRTRDAVVGSTHVSASDLFQVRIPAFNLVFVGSLNGDRLMLTPVTDAPQYDLKAGATVAASDLFTRLKPEAEKDKGLPR